MKERTSPPAAPTSRRALERMGREPTASRSSRTRMPARARAASAPTMLVPTSSLPRMKTVRSMVRVAAPMAASNAAYASSPVPSSWKAFPPRTPGTPSVRSTRGTSAAGCASGSPARPSGARSGACFPFAPRGNFRPPRRKYSGIAAQGAKTRARSHAIRLCGARRVTSTRIATTRPMRCTATSSGWERTNVSTVRPSVEGSWRGDERDVEQRRPPPLRRVVVPPFHPVGAEAGVHHRLAERLAMRARPRRSAALLPWCAAGPKVSNGVGISTAAPSSVTSVTSTAAPRLWLLPVWGSAT